MSVWSSILDWFDPARAIRRATRAALTEQLRPARMEPASDSAGAGIQPFEVWRTPPQEPALPIAAPDEFRESEMSRQQALTAPALPRRRVVAQLDRDESVAVILEGPEEEILWSIARRIESGRLDLPTLPSTSMAVIDLANHPSVEFQELVAQISMDPVLSSELLRTANSVLYGGAEPIDTLHSAIARIGLRALRSMILSVSMRGTILRTGAMAEYAEEVWRESYSVAMIAREIAPLVGIEPEKAFLLGLLQDIGKISLLAMLSKEVKDPRGCTAQLVGHVFQVFHQEAGAAMARKWKLPAEFASVAGCHHEWADNTAHTRSAALANLAYRLELAFSRQDPRLMEELRQLPALVYLAPKETAQGRILEIASKFYATDRPSSSLGV